MHEFKYRGKYLYCEEVSLLRIAKKFGTPLYVYSYHTYLRHFLKLKAAFESVRPLICYSVKANSNLTILKTLVQYGAGLDVVSGGELYLALKANCPAQKIVYASVGKTTEEIKEALNCGILFFNVESFSELENINRVAKQLGKTAQVAIRINPDVEPKTHHYITTGKLTNKFGVDFQTARQMLFLAKKLSGVKINGIHIHIGSQITTATPFVEAIKKVVNFIEKIEKQGIFLEYLNIGGGLGIVYKNEKPQSAFEFAKKVLPLLKKSKRKIIMEPGRFIIGSAGVLITKVLYIKKTPFKKFVIVDAGMNDLIRPSLYGAHHEIVPLKKYHTLKQTVDIVGPICESGDFLAKERLMPQLKEGDYLAVLCAGAYGFSMSSNYNSRLRAAEVLVDSKKVRLIRRRETTEDLINTQNFLLQH